MSRIRILGTLALLFYTLVSTLFWSNFDRDFKSHGLDYSQRRTQYAFKGLPLDRVAQQLDATLPQTTAVSFGPTIAADDFLTQRLTEVLYPRVVSPQASEVVDFNALASDQSTAPAVKLEFSFVGFLFSLISALGFGALVCLLFIKPIELLPGALVLAGSLVLALLATTATWFQFALSWQLVLWAGLLSGAAALAIATRRRLFSKPALPQFETCIFIGFLFIFWLRMVEFPVSLWDGRSVWLFNAKKLYLNGMMTRTDLTNPSFQFSNPSYPLLVPAWLSHFTSWGGSYNERMAALGYPVLFAGLLSLWWTLSRETLGRWLGAAFTFSLFFMFENMTSGGYTDQLVTLAIGLAILSFRKKETTYVGWLALVAASLIKAEGLAFAVLTALAFSRRISIWPLLCFIPAIVYRFWTRSIGVKDIFQDVKHGISDLVSRAVEFFELLPSLFAGEGYTASRFVSRAGTMAFIASIALAFWLVKKQRTVLSSTQQTGLTSLGLSVVTLIICCVVTAIVPFDVKWFFGVTVDRLLLLPSLLAILSLLLLTVQDRKRSNQ